MSVQRLPDAKPKDSSGSIKTISPLEVWIFFALILLANTVLVAGIANDFLPYALFPFGRFYLLGACLIAVVWLFRGPFSALSVLHPLTVWRINPLWFLLAALWPAIFTTSFLILQSLLTGTDLTLIQGAEILTNKRLMINNAIGALIGEIVWVGYAIRTLHLRMNIVIAALITGTVWTLWWGPMAYYNVGIIPDLPMIALWMNMIGIACFCAFLYHHTKSGIAVFVMQYLFNSTILIFPVLPTTGSVTTYYAFSACYMIVGLIAVLIGIPSKNRAPQAEAVIPSKIGAVQR